MVLMSVREQYVLRIQHMVGSDRFREKVPLASIRWPEQPGIEKKGGITGRDQYTAMADVVDSNHAE